VISSVQALDDNGVNRVLTTETATITPDSSLAYIAKNGSGLMLVHRGTGIAPGGSVPITVTISGVAADGSTPVSDDVFTFSLQGPPLPPLATHFTASAPNVRDTIGVTLPADPGADTISLL
jgi:hypothetical protein